jgi:hypothetical protein
MVWPVLLLYPEYGQSDFIRAFSEHDSLDAHLDQIFSPHQPPAPWDAERKYVREDLWVYFQSHAAEYCPPPQAVAAMDNIATGGDGAGGAGPVEAEVVPKGGKLGVPTKAELEAGSGERKWVRVKTFKSLSHILQMEGHVVPGLPTFHVFVKKSSFLTKFMSEEKRQEKAR